MMESQEILQNFVAEIKGIFGKSLKKIILYGSYARGDNRENSDMDIMILTTFTEDEIRAVENQVYDIAFDYELSDRVQISVNIKNEEHFNYWLGALPYYNNIRKEGIVLAG